MKAPKSAQPAGLRRALRLCRYVTATSPRSCRPLAPSFQVLLLLQTPRASHSLIAMLRQPVGAFTTQTPTMAGLIPKPNVGDPNSPTNISNNFIPLGAPQYNLSRIDAKVNYVPNKKSMLFARYSISPSFIFDPPALAGAGGDATGGGQNGNAFSRTQSVALGGSYQLTRAMLFDVNVGYTRLRLNAENTDIGTNFV